MEIEYYQGIGNIKKKSKSISKQINFIDFRFIYIYIYIYIYMQTGLAFNIPQELINQ